MSKPIVFIPGHTYGTGATTYTGLNEYDFNRCLCLQLATLEGVTVAHRYYENYSTYVKSLAGYIPSDAIVISLHLNSASIDVQGSEVLTSMRDYKMVNLSELLLAKFCKDFGTRNRGVKQPDERGGKLIENISNSLIWEPFFCNHRDEISSRFLDNPDYGISLMLKFWREAIDEYLR